MDSIKKFFGWGKSKRRASTKKSSSPPEADRKSRAVPKKEQLNIEEQPEKSEEDVAENEQSDQKDLLGATEIIGNIHSERYYPAVQAGPNFSDDEIEKLLARRGYKLDHELGRGSFAVVYQVRYKNPLREGSPEYMAREAERLEMVERAFLVLGNREKAEELYKDIEEEYLAVKVVDAWANKSYEFRVKFFPREMYILQKLQHPFIIRVHTVLGPYNYKYYIFLEIAEAGDLLEYIQRHGPVYEAQAKVWFRQMMKALNYCHGEGVAHRDLKCENVLLEQNGDVKLTDFGFARAVIDPDTGLSVRSRTFCGSAAYVAPEILLGITYNPLVSDMWSMGVILFVLLNNRFPFNDSNLHLMVKAQQNEEWNFSQRVADKISAECKDLCARLMQPNVRKRFIISDVFKHPWLADDIFLA